MIDLVLVTHPDPVAARDLVDRLVREHIIACGHMMPSGASVFFWEGEVRTEKEVLLVLKTVSKNRLILDACFLLDGLESHEFFGFIAVKHNQENHSCKQEEDSTKEQIDRPLRDSPLAGLFRHTGKDRNRYRFLETRHIIPFPEGQHRTP